MKKFFFLSIILLIFFIIIFITLNSEFRRSILNLSTGLINNYYEIKIKENLSTEEGVAKSINFLESQIKITNFITTDQKNSFMDNIYKNLGIIEKKIVSDKNLLSLSNSVKKIIKKDPKIYDALIWNAKIMNIENQKKEKIYDQIDSAIKLSPASAEAYKFAIYYSKKIGDEKKLKKYCEDFHSSFLGSQKIKNNISQFFESSLTRFAVRISSNSKIENYLIEGVDLNNAQNYFIGLKRPVDLANFELLSNFFPGTLIEILEIELRHSNDKLTKIPLENVFIALDNAFFIKDNKFQKIFVNTFNDEKILFKLDNKFKAVSQIIIKMKISKANITNIPNC